MASNRLHITFTALMVLGVAVFLEITLGLLAHLSPEIGRLLAPPWNVNQAALNLIEPALPDANLGHRPNPAYPGHDRKGFRNLESPASAHIVALGDSQTYGTGVALEDAWPRQLASKVAKRVYSMAYGGYGPAHSLFLWEEAAALSPAIVIATFYAGNDLFDAFWLVYGRGQLPELMSANPQVRSDILKAERSEPLVKLVSEMFRKQSEEAPPPVAKAGLSIRRFISDHSKIYGLARSAWRQGGRWVNGRDDLSQGNWEAAKSFAQARAPYLEAVSDGMSRTVLTSDYRLSALDQGDLRIAEGLRISLQAMLRMHELSAARGIRFVVLMIPTKEAVFRALVKSPAGSYARLMANEEKVWGIAREFFQRNGIDYLDSLPALREQLATGPQPYRFSPDGHPNAHGHAAIARIVASHLQKPGMAPPPAVQGPATQALELRR